MTDTRISGRNVEVLQTNVIEEDTSFSWASVVAGAIAATATTFILLALGSGLGFLAASPYNSSPSLTTLTVIGAIWIVLSQTWGFAVGGYLTGRLRGPGGPVTPDDENFRDGAHGFVAWALGVVLTATMVAFTGLFAAGILGHVTATLGAGAAVGAGAANNQNRLGPETTSYYVDTLFRTAPRTGAATGTTAPATPGAAATPQGETPPSMMAQPQGGASQEERVEVGRILTNSLTTSRLSDEDRAYVARVVAARTGMSQEEANRRVDDVVNRMRQAAKDAADKAAKAAAMISFWTFMALLMGAAAAVVGAIVGGNHRDEEYMANARLAP